MKKLTTESIEINDFVLTYFGGASRTKHPFKYRAIITLRLDGGRKARLYFHPDETSMPGFDKMTNFDGSAAHFLIEDYPNIVELLRSKKTTYFHKKEKWPTMAVISTDETEVGTED